MDQPSNPLTPQNAALPLSPADAAALFEPLFARERRILLAVSGGADSIALLVAAAEWARERPAPKLSVASVDHGLRPEAGAESAAVAVLSARLGLPHARLEAAVDGVARIEEMARVRRYAALAAHAEAIGAGAIATAHTLDDQAETVLMRLSAGSGPAGLAAMRARTVREGGLVHLRPFLGVAKARLVATLEERGIGWATDAMNVDAAYLRPRLRGARAALEREGLTAERLATLAARMARAEDALTAATEAAAAAHLTQAGAEASLAPGAASLPEEIRLRLLGRVIASVGGGVVRLDRLERLFERTLSKPRGAATLAGAKVTWDGEGRLSARPAAPRRST